MESIQTHKSKSGVKKHDDAYIITKNEGQIEKMRKSRIQMERIGESRRREGILT